jgi:actin-like ATPase involved in cell morphogenesis
MGEIIGIDLGTCYSAVVVPENRPGDGFLTLPGLAGYSVVLDRFHRRITPSVVAEDDAGNIIVGHAAKARAGQTPGPVMFAKRSMGEDVQFPLGKSGAQSAREISVHILRYLKKMAEERLGATVDQAVITYPAHFALKAKQMTEQAGTLAGFKTVVTAPEPVAAALMYCASDPRDPLRVMTYDLGGGTFDVAILEKVDGRISASSIKSSDGDRFLGGYNFDKSLAEWMLAQLRNHGFDLTLDMAHPPDRVIAAKLMIYAERAKIELSKSTVTEIIEPSPGIADHAGNPVSIHLEVTREQFESMIRDEIERSILICHRCRETAKPPVERDQLDEILMVGGSSRIPLVARRLQEEFGRQPRLIEPDLCVAIGAAIIAGTIKSTTVGGWLEMGSVPASTPLPSLPITGRITATAGCAPGAGRVTLRRLDGAYRKEIVPGSDGRFAFDKVPLARGAGTEFVLSLADRTGRELGSHRFSVRQFAGPEPGRARGPSLLVPRTPTSFLAKPVIVIWQDGPEVIAPARTPLPFSTTVIAKTSDASGRIRVPIHEDNTPLGEIIMSELPKTLPVGSEVEVTLSIGKNCDVQAEAYIKSLSKKEAVTLNLPLRPVPTLEELRRKFDLLAEQADDALRNASVGERFAGGKSVRLKERLAAARKMLDGTAPDASAVQDCLDEIEGLLREITRGWRADPPRQMFENKVKEAWAAHKKLIEQKPAAAQDGYDKQIEAAVREAEEAYARQHAALWSQAVERLDKIESTIRQQLAGENGGGRLPPPPALKLLLLTTLSQLKETAQRDGKLQPAKLPASPVPTSLTNLWAANGAEFARISEALSKIRADQPEATRDLLRWYETDYLHLQATLQTAGPIELLSRKKKE